MNIGIDHGYYAIKTRHFSFPAGIAEYSHEPYTLQNTLEFGGKFYVCGTGRQPILRNKMENDNYYLLTLAAIAKEIKQRGGKTECSVRIAAGLPLAGFGREKKPFREYLLRSSQPVCFKFEGIAYDVYREYMANNYEGAAPTLKDLYHSLLKQPEPEARGLALSSELFITGSLNTFAQHTNVDTKARIIAYDIRELGEQLMPIGMLVTLDAIFNRVIQNWKKGKTTWVFADEFYLLFRYQYSADFFYKLWKRIRKYNGLVTGLTQNVEELLRSDTARLMLANSEFLLLLNQSSTDRDELANLLHISDTQLGYITNVSAGCGLIRCAGNIVPFENSFPRNTRLYQLMTTKPDEALRGV